MKFSPLILPLLCAATFGPALASPTSDFHPLISDDSRNCYNDALSDAKHSHYQPALAKLESLIMVDAVPIAIDKANLPADAQGYEDSVSKGISIWRDALPDCPYRMVKDAAEHPAVLIKFVKSIANHGGDLQGMITAQHEFRWNGTQHSNKLNCTVFVVYKIDGRNLSHNEVSEVVAHELGHLLGLTDFMQPVGLMGPFIPGQPRLQPSPDEIKAVNSFRKTVRNQIDKIEDEL